MNSLNMKFFSILFLGMRGLFQFSVRGQVLECELFQSVGRGVFPFLEGGGGPPQECMGGTPQDTQPR